jgi:glutamate synthase (NADPH/NADH) small chain
MPKPQSKRGENDPWPMWTITLTTSSSHDEGDERKWSTLTKEFVRKDKG